MCSCFNGMLQCSIVNDNSSSYSSILEWKCCCNSTRNVIQFLLLFVCFVLFIQVRQFCWSSGMYENNLVQVYYKHVLVQRNPELDCMPQCVLNECSKHGFLVFQQCLKQLDHAVLFHNVFYLETRSDRYRNLV